MGTESPRHEYAVDPLEATFVREVMDADVYTLDLERSLADVYQSLPEGSPRRRQRLHPVIGPETGLAGVLPRSAVLAAKGRPEAQVCAAMMPVRAVAHPDEILRSVADRMAALGLGVLPVVDRVNPEHLEGLITQFDLLAARQKLLEEERHAERVLTLRRVVASQPGAAMAAETTVPGAD